jgi:hypothetical protein
MAEITEVSTMPVVSADPDPHIRAAVCPAALYLTLAGHLEHALECCFTMLTRTYNYMVNF